MKEKVKQTINHYIVNNHKELVGTATYTSTQKILKRSRTKAVRNWGEDEYYYSQDTEEGDVR